MFSHRRSSRRFGVHAKYVPEPFIIFPESTTRTIAAALRAYLEHTSGVDAELVNQLLLSQAGSDVIPALQETLLSWMNQ